MKGDSMANFVQITGWETARDEYINMDQVRRIGVQKSIDGLVSVSITWSDLKTDEFRGETCQIIVDWLKGGHAE
jgi:hypothetical protein